MSQLLKFISFELTLALRSKVLRNNLPLAACVFPSDEVAGSFHLGFYEQGEIVSVASFFPNDTLENEGKGYQLRGMATHALYAKKGYGKQLLLFAIKHLQNNNIQYLWCNARTSAVPFYTKMGFNFLSDEFEIDGIGPHYKMILILNKL